MKSHRNTNSYWQDVAQDEKVHSKPIQMNFAAWNIRTMLDRDEASRPERRSAIISRELSKYNMDIAALVKCDSPTLEASGKKVAIQFTGAGGHLASSGKPVLHPQTSTRP